MTSNLTAFLHAIAVSEIGAPLMDMPETDRGYRVLVGSTPKSPHLFTSYADHPRVLVYLPRLNVHSTAAGRYQILERIFDAYKAQLKLPDFSPASQDAIAIQLIKERGAIPMIETGDFAGAVYACRHAWASLPDAGFGQHENRLADLRTVYAAAGGLMLEA